MFSLSTACFSDLAGSVRSRNILAAIILSVALTASASAQAALSGVTPSGLTPGAPAGSYSLSGFESVNSYNGNLNFSLPLVSVGGRGGASTGLAVQIDQKWNVRREIVDPDYNTIVNYPDYNSWIPRPPYMGARAEIRRGGGATVTCVSHVLPDRPVYIKTLSRINVTLADGTEYEFRDSRVGGEPKNTTRNMYQCPTTAAQNRGQIFVTTDGSAATFVSGADIVDEAYADADDFVPEASGIMYLKDGSRWTFVGGSLTEIRDRNGNKVTFSGSSGTLTVTDSLNRVVSIALGYTDGTYGLCDKITYKGFGGASRTILVTKTNLTNVLKSGQTLKTYAQLFPSLNGSTSTYFNPEVKSGVILPNGKSYQFKYTSYGELARIDLPTGGAIEYDWDVGEYGNTNGGVVATATYMDYAVYRRILERRTYVDGSTLENKLIIERPTDFNSNTESSVVTETRDASNNLLAKQKSSYFGSALYSFSQTSDANSYTKWREAKEYKTEAYATNGSTVLRTVDYTWEQRTASSPFSWWSGTADDAPGYDPRLIETVTTLDDGQKSKTSAINPNDSSRGFDQFNNQTDVFEYDYGSGAVGSFVRRTHTDYATTVNGTDYINVAPTPTPTATPAQGTIHIRNLPTQTWVSSDSAGSTIKSRTKFEYDVYSTSYNEGLTSRSLISGHDSGYTTSYLTRGNATAIKRYENAAGETGEVKSFQRYDIAGNVVKIRDPRGCETSAAYGDSYGAPNGNATTNTSPSELSGVSQTSYAFATSVTNCLSQTVYSQFDFYTGMPVDGVDLNGVATSGYSTSDSLDRPTQIIRAVGQSEQSQTTFAYDDTNKKVTTTSDLASYNDNALKTESFYDGLGRTTETRRYEGSSAYIKTTQTYDAVGRIKRSYNPFRTTSDTTYGYAENTYDALGRVTAVATSDGSSVGTSYSGNTVTVTDQASKQRKSVTDALGRLKTVYEPDSGGTLNVNTDYTYDVLNNLLTVSQGSQTRTFSYDSLSRLTNANNPESGVISYNYDANGNLTHKTDGREIETFYTYDALNRVTERSYDAEPTGLETPVTTYTYDNVTNGIGRLTKVSNSNSETHYTAFDKMGRVTAHKQKMYVAGANRDYTTAYTYNLAGMLLEETYPGGRMVKNTIGSYGELSQVETKYSGGSYSTRASNFVYSAPGAVSSMQLGNSKYETTAFNSRMQPTQIGLGTSTSDTSLLKIEYGYGSNSTNNGNVTSQTITVPGVSYTFNQTYTYDNLNRIATATETYNGATTWSQTFGYDRYGNRNIIAGTGYTNLTFSSSNNKITTSGYTYDSSGNLTADPTGNKSLTYDSENKQTKVAGGGSTLGEYWYDGDVKRVKKDASNGDDRIFIYDATGKLVEERDLSNNVQTSYTYAGSRLLSTETTGTAPQYLTADHLSSPRINTDGTGNVTARHDYMPFGEEIFTALTVQRTSGVGYPGSDGVRKQFTGYERDGESGMDFAQARSYATGQGRFLSSDPIMISLERIGDPQMINLFGYVRNSPLRYVDPTGEKFKGTDGKEVIIKSVKGKLTILSNNATDDLIKLVDALNQGGSETAIAQFNSLNSRRTMISVVLNPIRNNTYLYGLHQPHGTRPDGTKGPLTFNSDKDKFEGTVDTVKEANGQEVYAEATITIYEAEIMNAILLRPGALALNNPQDELLAQILGTFVHEGEHDLDPNQVQLAKSGKGDNKVWHPDRLYKLQDATLMEVRQNTKRCPTGHMCF